MKLNSDFWHKDWFLGICVVLVIALFYWKTDLIQSLEYKAYDLGVQASSRPPSNRIAIIAIDDQSISNIGRWPWSRDVHAKMTDLLSGAKAKVITNTTFFFEPQKDPGLGYINQLLETYQKTLTSPGATDIPLLAQFGVTLKEAETALNTDRRLAQSFSNAGNVLLPMFMTLGEPLGRPDNPLPDYVLKSSVRAPQAPPSLGFQAPIPELGQPAAGIGQINTNPNIDGSIREEALAVNYFDKALPSLSLLTAARSLNLGPQDIQINEDRVKLGKLKITAANTRMLTYFYKNRDGRDAFQKDSFSEVLSGKISAAKYADKIVLIGATASGVGSNFPTPIGPTMAPVEILAHTVSSILSEHFFVQPIWSGIVTMALFLLIASYLIVALPRLKASMGAMITSGLLLTLLATQFGLMLGSGLVLEMMLPVTLLLLGHACLTTKRFLITEEGKQKSDTESAESNRMLGLAFQGQGQLDMAFDKFRKCPLDDTLMDNIYNLALDFERKRQFNKAQAAYEYMGQHNPKFRDLEQKLSRAKTMSETIILGGGAGVGRSNASLLALDGSAEKPMLGRYQIEKELGKGAMGVVYQGKDPKIGRVVAIKTFAISQEFEGEEMQEAKERFFREAETAGRLAHPNIVTIYDAGEEQELCFIAMELLKGKDLVPYTKPDALLAPKYVISIVIRVAEALAYAHRTGVVHRDIKPANIMYEPENDVVKVADFGIARITDSSKTKTGMVLGTPSYMSPEQLYGMKVDGRSDIFSLSVSMYLMLSGHLPFVGDSMGQLMFKIANEPTPDIRLVRSNVPPPLVAILFKGMEKDIEKRYQSGDALAQDLRALLAGKPISAPAAPPLTRTVAPAAATPAAAGAASAASAANQATVKIDTQKPLA